MVTTPWYFATRLKPADSADYRLKLYALAIYPQFCVRVKVMNQSRDPKFFFVPDHCQNYRVLIVPLREGMVRVIIKNQVLVLLRIRMRAS
jgi:hypothetical protein